MMARKRKNKHGWLPRHVFLEHGTYYFRKSGQRRIRLGRTPSEMYQELSKLVKTAGECPTMTQLFDRYIAEVASQKAPRTYQDNIDGVKYLKAFFNLMSPPSVTSIHVYEYLDTRGKKSKVRANREISLLSHVFVRAIRWGIVKTNPCFEIEKHPETKRNRDVQDEEFNAVYEVADPIVKIAMMLSYLMGLRLGEVLTLKRRNLTEKGILVEMPKTKRFKLIKWSTKLRTIVDDAILLRPRSEYVVCNRRGERYTPGGFKALWYRTMEKALNNNLLKQPFRFNDLRHKAATDAEKKNSREYARKLLGHRTQAITARYIDGIYEADALD